MTGKFLRIALPLCLAAALAGCVTKSAAEAQVRLAYLAGQQAAYAQIHQQETQGPTVTVIGPVQNPVVKWTEGLTLDRAIVMANYTSQTDPKTIVIRRRGVEVPIDPKRLLQGEDIPLEPGDTVELQLSQALPPPP